MRHTGSRTSRWQATGVARQQPGKVMSGCRYATPASGVACCCWHRHGPGYGHGHRDAHGHDQGHGDASQHCRASNAILLRLLIKRVGLYQDLASTHAARSLPSARLSKRRQELLSEGTLGTAKAKSETEALAASFDRCVPAGQSDTPSSSLPHEAAQTKSKAW